MTERVLAGLLLGLSFPAFAQSDSLIKAVDVYRSRALTVADVKKAVGSQLQAYGALRAEPKRSNKKAAERLKTQIENKLRSMGPIAHVTLSYQEYITSAERKAYVTIDVVDKADAAQRMPFALAPTGSPIDPEGLVATWQRYYELGDGLSRQGLFSMTDRPTCPSFFCIWGSRTPELAQFEQKMLGGATPNQRLLREVLKNEADAKKRAAAVYVLAYQKDGNAVIEMALQALRDPSPEVRSAALQVLADMAVYYKAFAIDVDRVIAALDYPNVADRARALAVLVGLADNPLYRAKVMNQAAPYLVALLRLNQPSNHDLAFTLLATLSQESYDRHDYQSWNNWVEARSSSSTVNIVGVSTDDGR